ncbi:DUF4222 domain-containing protein [Salmonella enterica subsp. enterica serovar Glostrup]|nr:DUF4222 domain-containing protein [Salmonella enterica subsp. enterica serovar Glostrup]
MKRKNSGFAVSGPARPEICPGDIFQDNRGERVTVKMVTDNRITYIREGYSGECVFPATRFEREFTLIREVPPAELSDINRIMSVTGAERIRAVREIIRERGKLK